MSLNISNNTKYNYRPLPSYLTIRTSSIDGLGLFALEPISEGLNMGVTHIMHLKAENGLLRTPLGGFINHSLKSNCTILKSQEDREDCFELVAIRDIGKGEEILINYHEVATSKLCGFTSLNK